MGPSVAAAAVADHHRHHLHDVHAGRYWTTLSLRRALLSLMVSLAVTFVIAPAAVSKGVARRDGVFLRTSKVGRPPDHFLRASA